jgi:hypothetical protein
MRTGRLWLLGGAVLGLVVIGLGWLIGASPLLAAAAANERQTAAIDAANAQEEIAIALMREQFENIDELRAELDELQLSIPGFADTASYFNELSAKAIAATVSLQSVTVSGAQPYGAMGSTQSSGGSSGSGTTSGGQLPGPKVPSAQLADSLYVLTVELSVDADADRLAAFLAALQGDGRLMLVTKTDATFGTTQRATITGYIFVVHDPRLGPVGSLPTTVTPTPAAEPTAEPTAEPESTEDTPSVNTDG